VPSFAETLYVFDSDLVDTVNHTAD